MFIDRLIEPGDPVDPTPTNVAITSIIRTSSEITLQVSGGAGVTGDVEYSSTLESGGWTVILSGVPLGEPVVDTDADRISAAQGFYRVIMP